MTKVKLFRSFEYTILSQMGGGGGGGGKQRLVSTDVNFEKKKNRGRSYHALLITKHIIVIPEARVILISSTLIHNI